MSTIISISNSSFNNSNSFSSFDSISADESDNIIKRSIILFDEWMDDKLNVVEVSEAQLELAKAENEIEMRIALMCAGEPDQESRLMQAIERKKAALVKVLSEEEKEEKKDTSDMAYADTQAYKVVSPMTLGETQECAAVAYNNASFEDGDTVECLTIPW